MGSVGVLLWKVPLMVKLDDMERFLGPRINALAKQGYVLSDMQVVLGKDTFTALRGNLNWVEDCGGNPKQLFGIDYVVDTDTPRLHSVRVKLSRRKASA